MKRIMIASLLLMGFQAAGQELGEQAPGLVNEAGDPMAIEWDLRCFPNPTSDLLIVKSSKEIKSIEFFDLNGRNLELPVLPNNCYSLNDLPTGWVFMLVESVDGFVEKKNVYKQ